MINISPNGAQMQRLYVKAWMKVFIYGACLMPILLMLWMLRSQFSRPNGNILVVAVICIAVAGAFGWLFIRLYSLCSVKLDSEGVSQSFALHRHSRVKRVHLKWDQVQGVSFVRHSYHFIGADGSKIELNVALFDDAETTISTVRRFLPQRLLTQLDLPTR